MSGARRRRQRGQHFLVHAEAADLVRHAGVRPGDLVLEIGTGTGVLTVELARTGARVVTFEIDGRLARRATERLGGFENVRVVRGDFLAQPLPRRAFRVVANLPFAGSAAIMRRLLDPRVPLTRADVVVAWGAALGWTAETEGRPRPDAVRWARWYELRIERRIPASAFRPPPSTDAALLAVRRRRNRRNSVFVVTGRR